MLFDNFKYINVFFIIQAKIKTTLCRMLHPLNSLNPLN